MGGQVPRQPGRGRADRAEHGGAALRRILGVPADFGVPIVERAGIALPAWTVAGHEDTGLDKRPVITAVHPRTPCDKTRAIGPYPELRRPVRGEQEDIAVADEAEYTRLGS